MLMTKKIITLALAAAALCLLACQPEPVETSLGVSTKTLSFEALGNAEKAVNINTNADWTVKADQNWVTVKPASGSGDAIISVSVADNTGFDARTAVITVTADDKKADIAVSQLASVPSVAIAPTTVEKVPTIGGDLEFTVTSNADWTIASSADWATVAPASGNGNGTFKVSISRNFSFEERSATIAVTAMDKKAEVKIVQEANQPVLTVSPETIEPIAAEGGTVEVNVMCNDAWTVSVSEGAEWLKATVTNDQTGQQTNEASGDRTVVITAEPNVTDFAGRSAVVTIAMKDFADKAVSLTVSQLEAPHTRYTDSLALVAIYNASKGETWAKNNWDLSAEISTWNGVTLDQNGRVSVVKITTANTITEEWSLPEEVGNLTELTDFRVNGNKLTGSIPECIYGLAKLQKLYFQNNNLTGALSSKLGDLTELTELYIDRNTQLGGSLPSSIGNLKKLKSINIAKTAIGGTIPAELVGCEALANFMAYENKLEGPLPDIWDKFANIGVLQLYGNPGLECPLPESMGRIVTSAKTLSLQLKNCNFTGNIPVSFGNLPSVCSQLMVNGNKLKGVVPAEVQAHPNWAAKWKPDTNILPQQEGYGLTLE